MRAFEVSNPSGKPMRLPALASGVGAPAAGRVGARSADFFYFRHLTPPGGGWGSYLEQPPAEREPHSRSASWGGPQGNIENTLSERMRKVNLVRSGDRSRPSIRHCRRSLLVLSCLCRLKRLENLWKHVYSQRIDKILRENQCT